MCTYECTHLLGAVHVIVVSCLGVLITEGKAQGNLLALYYLYVHMSVHTYGEQYMYIRMFVPLLHALVCTYMDMSACTSNSFPLCPEYCFLNLPAKGVLSYSLLSE